MWVTFLLLHGGLFRKEWKVFCVRHKRGQEILFMTMMEKFLCALSLVPVRARKHLLLANAASVHFWQFKLPSKGCILSKLCCCNLTFHTNFSVCMVLHALRFNLEFGLFLSASWRSAKVSHYKGVKIYVTNKKFTAGETSLIWELVQKCFTRTLCYSMKCIIKSEIW